MISRVLGSVLLIVAMSVGGGLLSLPVVTAAAGFGHATLLLIGVWLMTTLGSLFILEVCLRLPEDTNLIAMAKHTLGRGGQAATWFFYLLMLYCILCVYISGGTDLVQHASDTLSLHLPSWASTLLFSGGLSLIVWHGITLVDYANRGLMAIKMLSYLALLLVLAPSTTQHSLPSGTWAALSGALMPAIFSFGHGIVIPSLRSYLNSNTLLLRWVIVIGSFIPLLCFLAWNYVVQNIIPQDTLIAISHSGKVISQLTTGLSSMGNPWVINIARVFTSICIFTAFLAVSLSLSDFIADGINKKKQGLDKWLIHALTVLPPVMIVVFNPYIFITAIRYAGIFVVIILMLLPTLMVWKSQSQDHTMTAPSLFQRLVLNRGTMLLMLAASLFLLGFALLHL